MREYWLGWHAILLLVGGTLGISLSGAEVVAKAEDAAVQQSTEQLVIFVQGEVTEPPNVSEHLSQLRTVAEEMGVAVEMIDVAGGAPPVVKLTPLVVFQDPRGRTIFQARYADVGKLRHFIRTSRAIPPDNTVRRRSGLAVLEEGRSLTGAPIKVTRLLGELPPSHDDESFRALAERAILSGFRRFGARADVELGPSNRLFYMDFYPHRSAAGELSVSLALFSQFNCIEPVFRRFADPVTGSWEESERVFARAAEVLETEVLRQISASEIGDAFRPVASSVPAVSWQDLGLSLPPVPAGLAKVQQTPIDLPERWRIEPSTDGEPRLVFRFPAPLERYSGEVQDLMGELNLAADRSLDGAVGWIEAVTGSVTMGEPMLDRAIHTKMIHASDFPVSRFELDRVESGSIPLTFGRPSPMVAHGRFSLMGFTIPVEVKGEIEPVIGEDFAPRLQVRATFSIALSKPFGIAGPDGPAPANDTLVFYLSFRMQEASGTLHQT